MMDIKYQKGGNIEAQVHCNDDHGGARVKVTKCLTGNDDPFIGVDIANGEGHSIHAYLKPEDAYELAAEINRRDNE